jgi:WD40 repeat protein/transcriptional regulator with XRE-family HTH domain
MQTPQPPDSFRGLLLRHRGRTGLTQRDVAARAGVSLRSIQDWEAGVTLPTAERLQKLIQVFLDAGGLSRNSEAHEALELWTTAERESARMRASFDDAWFADLLAAHTLPTPVSAADAQNQPRAVQPLREMPARAQDWGEAPDTTRFVGRADELAMLRRWVLDEGYRLIAVLGMGGIGKTSLAARLAQTAAPSFERVYWRSLRDAPPVSEWLAGAIAFISDQQLAPPPKSERITALLQLLRARRSLLVLDNFETLLDSGQREGLYRTGMDGYGRVLQAVGETSHQSCVVLTSRETPPELTLLDRRVRSLDLRGLDTDDAQALLADKQLYGDPRTWLSLVDRYGGNGLALKIVGDRIHQVYGGDVAAFLVDAIARYGSVFGGIRRLLDAQTERLSTVERDILTRLAVGREPVSVADLAADMASIVGRRTVVEAVDTLRQRSLVEHGERRATFTLQSMVLEYMTDRVVETVAEEIGVDEPEMLLKLPLIKARAKDYVRQTQERLIGGPILRQLTAEHGEVGAEMRLRGLLEKWRGQPPDEQDNGPGNVVNLLRILRGHLRGLDLSRLAIRHAYLQGVEAEDASLAGAHLSEAVLAEAFSNPSSVAISADGAYLVAGTATGEVCLWRLADRTLQAILRGHTGTVWGVAASRDGQLLASGSLDRTVRLWAAETGECLATLRGHDGGVWGVALSADGRLVASGSFDGTVKLWATATGGCRATLRGHAGGVRGVALSSDGRLVATGGQDGTVRLWAAESEACLATLEGHSSGVWAVALSGDGRLVASGSLDCTVRLWATDSAECLATLEGHTNGVWAVALSEGGQVVASSSLDQTVRLWASPAGRLLTTLQAHTGPVTGVALNRDGQLLASGSDDGTIRLWEGEPLQPLATLQGHGTGVWAMALSMDGRLVASGGQDGTVQLWEVASARPLAALRGHEGGVWAVAVSPDSRLVATGSLDGTVKIWAAGSGECLATLRGHGGGVRGVALSRDCRVVVSGGQDGTIRVWDVESGGCQAVLPVQTGPVIGVALSSNSRLVAGGSFDGAVTLWELETRRPLVTLEGQAGPGIGMALSDDGQLVAGGSDAGIVTLWDTESGEVLATLQGHTGRITCVAISGDGRFVASGSDDATIRLWTTPGGRPVATLRGNGVGVWAVALSADGSLVASGGLDGMARLWDVRRGSCLRELRADRRYERLNIAGLTGVTVAQRSTLMALGALEGSHCIGPRS